MANLKMVIKVREKTGSRRWLHANEKSAGSFYIQWCEGSKAKLLFVGTDECLVVYDKYPFRPHGTTSLGECHY
jgi:hypothetical protein